jgi:hypothetical protein
VNDEELEDLMYRAGLTAQGCWDSMDQYAREAIMDFAKRVAAAEREACAKLCDELRDEDGFEPYGTECAAAIRARGET